ncbi:hypothetical protein BJ912DRAFT_816867, partial [Pholiota molesta]
LCRIFLTQRAGTISIDQSKSHCPNIRAFSIKKAEEFTAKQPCTNHPLFCPLCQHGAAGVWKYNLKAHIQKEHPSHDVMLYETFWGLHRDEELLMKIEWDKLKRHRLRPSKDTSARKLKISDAH